MSEDCEDCKKYTAYNDQLRSELSQYREHVRGLERDIMRARCLIERYEKIIDHLIDE